MSKKRITVETLNRVADELGSSLLAYKVNWLPVIGLEIVTGSINERGISVIRQIIRKDLGNRVEYIVVHPLNSEKLHVSVGLRMRDIEDLVWEASKRNRR